MKTNRFVCMRVLFLSVLALLLVACMETAPRATSDATPDKAAASGAPTFGNPSPNVGSSTSEKAHAAADAAAYKEVAYKNSKKKGPALIVIPGEIKSNNASFTQKVTPNNIADLANWNCRKPISRCWSGPIWGIC